MSNGAPETHSRFTTRHPKLAEAWSTLAEAGNDGPLDDRHARLIKLAVAIGALREGAVRASVRKAIDAGIERDALDQVLALAAATAGLPGAAAAFQWIEDEFAKRAR
jgi:alkylhydroperoxidase/carboxymuconolactone decarboxylase family protein YurZ